MVWPSCCNNDEVTAVVVIYDKTRFSNVGCVVIN